MKIILASKSPARKKLLAELGLKFDILPAEIDEDKIRLASPSLTVKKIAYLKAKKVIRLCTTVGHLLVIAADTLVYLPKNSLRRTVYGTRQQGRFIGKPKDKTQAKEILNRLSGTTHWLYSGICVLYVSGAYQRSTQPQGLVFLDYDKTKVTFRKLSEKEIDEYVNKENVHLWAGAYTIEKGTPGASFVSSERNSFIKKIEGSNTNVLGMPMKKLRKILGQIGLI